MTKTSKKIMLIISITLVAVIITIIAVALFPRSFPKLDPNNNTFDIIVTKYSYSSQGDFITDIYDKHPSADNINAILQAYTFHMTTDKAYYGATQELLIVAPIGKSINIFSTGIVRINNSTYKLYGGESAAQDIINKVISLVA